MSTIIVSLLGLDLLTTIFAASFFFGLIFFIFVIISALGSDDGDVDDTDAGELDDGLDEGALIDIDGDGVADGLDVDGDGIIDVELDFDADFDADFDMDTDLDTDFDADMEADFDGDLDGDLDSDLDGDLDSDLDTDLDSDTDFEDFEHVELDHAFEAEPRSDKTLEYRSNYKMGNISVFLLFFGQIGLLNSSNLQDYHIGIAVLVGFIAMKVFGAIIANYAKTIVVPIQRIRRGDVGIVLYGIRHDKTGLIQVHRRDGVVSTVLARGAFPHDTFDRNEKGYIWAKEDETYLITKGHINQPALKKQPKTKKALDA